MCFSKEVGAIRRREFGLLQQRQGRCKTNTKQHMYLWILPEGFFFFFLHANVRTSSSPATFGADALWASVRQTHPSLTDTYTTSSRAKFPKCSLLSPSSSSSSLSLSSSSSLAWQAKEWEQGQSDIKPRMTGQRSLRPPSHTVKYIDVGTWPVIRERKKERKRWGWGVKTPLCFCLPQHFFSSLYSLRLTVELSIACLIIRARGGRDEQGEGVGVGWEYRGWKGRKRRGGRHRCEQDGSLTFTRSRLLFFKSGTFFWSAPASINWFGAAALNKENSPHQLRPSNKKWIFLQFY